MHEVLPPDRKGSRPEEDRKLYDFTHLNLHGPQGNPPRRPVDAPPDARHEYGREQEDREDEKPGRHALPESERNAVDHPGGEPARKHEDHVAHDEVIGGKV